MKTLLKTTAVAAALVFAPAAMAQDMGWYGDVGLGLIKADLGVDLDFTTVQGHLGYDINDNFGIEGELAIGVDGDLGVDLDHQAGVYGVLSTANTDGFEFFGRLGYGIAEVSGGGTSVDSDGFAYGVGGKYYFDGVNGMRLDLTQFDGDADATLISLGYARKF